MGQWHKAGCVLCAQNCGLEVLVEENRMVKVRPDKSNLRSQGYTCREGLNVIYHQYPKDRLTEPLKRVGNSFETISWDQAVGEIAEKMKGLVDPHGFGLIYGDSAYGINVNRLTKNTPGYFRHAAAPVRSLPAGWEHSLKCRTNTYKKSRLFLTKKSDIPYRHSEKFPVYLISPAGI